MNAHQTAGDLFAENLSRRTERNEANNCVLKLTKAVEYDII
jgi:hypothetical protein